jgi:integrase
MRRAVREFEGGMPAKPRRLTFEAYLEEWLATVRVTKRATTAEDYERKVRLHIVPVLGKLPLSRLSAADLERLQAAKVEAGLVRSIPRIRQVIHRALAVAVRKRLINRNVADEVDWVVPEAYEGRTLTVEEARRLLRACLDHPLGTVLIVDLCTGMRKGEVLALHWRDVDLDGGSLLVRYSLASVKGRGLVIGPTKTRRSRRPLPIPPLVVEALRHHRVRQAEARMLGGPAWDDLDLVFANEVGRPLHAGNFHRRVYKPLLAGADVPDIRFHDLRHSMATLLYSIGADPQTLKSLLGHSKITTTMDTYAHPVSEVQRAEVNRLGSLLSESGEDADYREPVSKLNG